ncbi:hypothetical protein LEMLEM_LOCUS25797 [Lemmus lemmus]
MGTQALFLFSDQKMQIGFESALQPQVRGQPRKAIWGHRDLESPGEPLPDWQEGMRGNRVSLYTPSLCGVSKTAFL